MVYARIILIRLKSCMFEKIAVVFRGHVRTWHQINKYVFENFSKISKSVDYYFVTWDIPGVDDNTIKNSFNGQNLIKFVSVSTEKYYNGTQGPSWLSNCICPFLENKNYDIIIDSRPDVLPVVNLKIPFNYSAKSIYIIWESIITDRNNVTASGISDIFHLMSVENFKIYCTRYTKPSTINNHVDLKNFYIDNSISLNVLVDFIRPEIVRPTQVNHLQYDPSIQLRSPWLELWNNWDRLSDQNKIVTLNKYNILLEDYNLKLNN